MPLDASDLQQIAAIFDARILEMVRLVLGDAEPLTQKDLDRIVAVVSATSIETTRRRDDVRDASGLGEKTFRSIARLCKERDLIVGPGGSPKKGAEGNYQRTARGDALITLLTNLNLIP